MGKVIQAIQKAYPGLRASEKRAADFVLSHPQQVQQQTLASVAVQAGVSEPTVMRFSRAVGYGSFSDLRLALAREEAPPPKPLLDVHVTREDALDTLPEKMIRLSMRALEDTRSSLDRKCFVQAVDKLRGARLIDIYGVGNSGAVAQDMATKLMRIGLICRAYPDSHLQQIGACSLGRGDVAVGISHSGATKDTVDALRIAKERGAETIAITNFRGMDILRYADLALLTGDVETEFYTETMLSRISQLAIVDSLYMGLLLSDYEARSHHLTCVNEMVSRKVYEKQSDGR